MRTNSSRRTHGGVDIVGMNTETIVDHREMRTPSLCKRLISASCVRHQTNAQVGDNAIRLLSDRSAVFILLIYQQRATAVLSGVLFSGFMNTQSPRCVTQCLDFLRQARATFRSQFMMLPASTATSGMHSSNTLARYLAHPLESSQSFAACLNECL